LLIKDTNAEASDATNFRIVEKYRGATKCKPHALSVDNMNALSSLQREA